MWLRRAICLKSALALGFQREDEGRTAAVRSSARYATVCWGLQLLRQVINAWRAPEVCGSVDVRLKHCFRRREAFFFTEVVDVYRYEF